MNKTFRKIISLFIVAAFMLTAIPTFVMANVTLPGSWQSPSAQPWTGNKVPQASLLYTEGSAVNVGTSDFAVEFSFAMTDESDIVTVFTPMYKAYNNDAVNLTSNATYYYFNISATGATIFGTTTSFAKPLSLNRWYNAVAVYDVCNDSTGTNKQSTYNYKLYINGELYANAPITTTLYEPRYN